MRKRAVASILTLTAAVWVAASPASIGLSSPQTPSTRPSDPKAPSDAEVQRRAAKLIENQHRDDLALDTYERTERHLDRTGGSSPHILLDKTYRVVPTGGGTMKLLLSDHGTPVDPRDYRHQLRDLRDTLRMMSNPNDPRAKAAYDKYQKRQHDRADFVDMARTAFLVKWQGREMRNGRMCDVFALTPSPDFHPHSMYQSAMAHVTATVWLDAETNQMVRGEGHVTSDIYFGAGILGKLSRGSRVSLEQAEVAPGIWLPTRYEYDYSGRKFLFSFEQHQSIDADQYRRIGPPSEALAAIQQELADGKPAAGDP